MHDSRSKHKQEDVPPITVSGVLTVIISIILSISAAVMIYNAILPQQ